MSLSTLAYARRAYKSFSRSARHVLQLIAGHQNLQTGWAYLSYQCLSLRFQHRVHPCAVSPYFARTSCRVPISGGTSLSLAPKSKEYSAT
jgi:hypothetical protein